MTLYYCLLVFAAGHRTSDDGWLGLRELQLTTIFPQLTSETLKTSPVSLRCRLKVTPHNLAGELSGIANQRGSVEGYGYDKTGRLSSVAGSGPWCVRVHLCERHHLSGLWGHQGNELRRREIAHDWLRYPFAADELERFQRAGFTTTTMIILTNTLVA